VIESLIKLIYFYSFELKATNDLLQEQSKDTMIIKLKRRDKTRGLYKLNNLLTMPTMTIQVFCLRRGQTLN